MRSCLLITLFLYSKVAAAPPKVDLLFPIDGLVLTDEYDVSDRAGLQIMVLGTVSLGSEVWINGKKAHTGTNIPNAFKLNDNHLVVDYRVSQTTIDPGVLTPFFLEIDVAGLVVDLEIIAANLDDMYLNTAVCYYLENSKKTFSITIDDAIDLLKEADGYQSVFHQPVFQFLRKMNLDYGATFSLYLFEKGNLYESFDLEQMSDRFRSEWERNSDWLRLGFHAKRKDPSYPYRNTSYEKALVDYLSVRDQVFRFAGESSWDRVLRSHYWSGSLESCRAWRDEGIRGFYGAVGVYESYYLTDRESAFVKSCDYWRDNIENIGFIQTDIWIEKDFKVPKSRATTSHELVLEKLGKVLDNTYGSHNVQLFTHESFLPPYAEPWGILERIEESIAWLTDRGYTPRLDGEDLVFDSLPGTPPFEVRETGRDEDVFSIDWKHSRNGENYTYAILRKDFSNLLGEWVSVGETDEQRFTGRQPTEEAYVYRVYAIDEEGLWSGGSFPVLLGRRGEKGQGDFNGDGVVDLADFFAFADNFGDRGTPDLDEKYDLDGDGEVNYPDFFIFVDLFTKK